MKPQSLTAIFALPLVLAAVTIVGLVAALLGDGLFDAVSWVALAVPLLPIARAFRRRKEG